VTRDYWRAREEERQRAGVAGDDAADEDEPDPFAAAAPSGSSRRSGWAAESGDLMRQ